MNKLWVYLKTKDFRNNFLGAIGVVIGIVLIVSFSLSFYTRHGEGIPVPQLTGMPVENAIATLQDQGFEYKIDSIYVLDKAPGTITQQDPDAGTNVKEGRVIYLTMVTRLAPTVTLPKLDESTYREAVAALSNYGLKVGDTTYRADVAKDRVLEVRFSGQILKEGDKVPKGSKLDLVLGNGEGSQEVDIPELVNLDLDAAKFAIRGSGLTIGNITYQGAITDSANLVVVQQIPAKTDSVIKTSHGARIDLTVIQGKRMNRRIEAAEMALRLKSNKAMHLLDVRETIEYHTYNIGGLNIPLAALPNAFPLSDWDITDEIIVICKVGLRSKTAQSILLENGYTNVRNLAGGLIALQKLK